MNTIGSLWLAILIAAALVFVASSLIWMVMPWHKKDWKALPDEDAARRGIGGGVEPGQYVLPHMGTRAAMKDPAYLKKLEEGPVVYMTVVPRGMPAMGKNMVIWFIYSLLVGVSVAYIATRTLQSNVAFLSVFRVTGTVAWLAYGWSSFTDAIWFGKPWSNTFKQLFDALIYAVLTAGAFAWLWPR